jgi:hypothetical protein
MYSYNSPNKVFFLEQDLEVCKERSNLADQHEESICGWKNWSDVRILTFLRAVVYTGRVSLCFVVWQQQSAGKRFNDLK